MSAGRDPVDARRPPTACSSRRTPPSPTAVRARCPTSTRSGVGALYASPLLESGAGSNHGYDVVDPTRVSGERGGEEGRRALVAAVRERGLGFLLDIVPNHVGVDVREGQPVVVGRAHARPRVARTRRTSTSTGTRARCCSRSWVPRLDRATRRRCSPSSSPSPTTAPSCATTSTPSPWRPAPARASAQEVHERQHYRLVSWKRGAAELTYRRFFDVSTLAAVRVEDPEVFAATHARGAALGARPATSTGCASTTRTACPTPAATCAGCGRRSGPTAGCWWRRSSASARSCPSSWPVDGTSGYEALREICGVFVDPDGAGLLTQLAAEHTGRKENAHAAEHAARREVADTILAAEVRRIAALVPVPDAAPSTDEEPGPLRTGCARPSPSCSAASRSTAATCPRGARRSTPRCRWRSRTGPDLADVVGVIAGTMLGDPEGELATRVQQTSGMVMAKGVEDTTFYRYNRFVALNEVGGDPDRFGVSPAEFHDRCAGRVASWPRTMTTLSTHDTKRSEDVRARLAVLAEIPDEWAARLRRWAAAHPLPDRSLELLAWQSLVGAWPISAERLAAYLGKASKEAKLVTSHVDANAEVDAAVAAWPAQVLGDPEHRARRSSEFVARDRRAGPRQLAGPEAAADRRAGRPRRLPGHRAVRVLAGRPGQPAPGRLGAAPGAAGAHRRRLAARFGASTPTRTARRSCWSPRRRCCCAGSGPSCSPATGPSRPRARRRSTRSRSSGPRQLVAVATRLPVGLAARGGWARHRPARCRTGPPTGRTC